MTYTASLAANVLLAAATPARASVLQGRRARPAVEKHGAGIDAADECLSIAIALFGLAALTQKRWLLAFASLLGALGIRLGLSGFLALLGITARKHARQSDVD